MKTPKVGQLVYVGHLSVRNITKPSVRISEREFYRACSPAWAKNKMRWVVGPPGKAQFEGSIAPFGIAYKPEAVFETREAAQTDVNSRIDTIVANLLALKK